MTVPPHTAAWHRPGPLLLAVGTSALAVAIVAVIGTGAIDAVFLGTGYLFAWPAVRYSAPAPPWMDALLTDQRLAGELTLVIGEPALQVAVVALTVRWGLVDDAAVTSWDSRAATGAPAPADDEACARSRS